MELRLETSEKIREELAKINAERDSLRGRAELLQDELNLRHVQAEMEKALGRKLDDGEAATLRVARDREQGETAGRRHKAKVDAKARGEKMAKAWAAARAAGAKDKNEWEKTWIG